MQIAKNLKSIKESLLKNVTLVAVSKTKPISDLQEAYNAGQRIFGENKIQEMTAKYEQLPKDIEWHMIGHVQANKVKYMAPFVSLIHGVDSLKLLKEIDKQAAKNKRKINCLLQLRIAQEETKFGMQPTELMDLFISDEYENLEYITICGLMGMASFVSDRSQVQKEFQVLKQTFDTLKQTQFSDNESFNIISMGMSGDYSLAIQEGSNMIRVGSAIFGTRNYN